MEMPPAMRSAVDQQEAMLRDLLNKAMATYREHAELDHEGEPNVCSQSLLVFDYMGMRVNAETASIEPAGHHPLPTHLAYALVAYAVERIYIGERDRARAAAEILAVSEELKALKADIEAGR
ncbi:hypothetical protein BST13_33690 [Mycobacterium aquaticum]|uniref:Uncharacterized protein n=2 Tax=Mycobacterium aquaticum TaxID=1927124 RepID=A0A1X0A4B9_9MYCO|nr:hypothetical protein BST13_33690 [Mycobacterium aquaticum]